MYTSEYKIRTRYSETDQMGFVHHGVYPTYFEIARTELLKDLGMNYAEMEKQGIMLPVRKLELEYLNPAFYDDELKIITYIDELPTVKMNFRYELYRNTELLTKANALLVFMNAATRKAMKPPIEFLEKLRPFFD